MKNIFKTFKENESLIAENKLLKAQNEALTAFRKSFDSYYNDISGVRVITRTRDKQIALSGTFSINNATIHCPVEICKEKIARQISEQLLPLIEFDVVDNHAYGTKDITGRLVVLMK